MFYRKNMFLKISQNSQENTTCQSPFFNKVIKRETVAQVFSWMVAGKCFSCKKAPLLQNTSGVSYIFVESSILTLSCRRPLSYRTQFIDLQSKSIDWFVYDKGLRHERVNINDFIFFPNYFLC